jgi:hypothetical protein
VILFRLIDAEKANYPISLLCKVRGAALPDKKREKARRQWVVVLNTKQCIRYRVCTRYFKKC